MSPIRLLLVTSPQDVLQVHHYLAYYQQGDHYDVSKTLYQRNQTQACWFYRVITDMSKMMQQTMWFNWSNFENRNQYTRLCKATAWKVLHACYWTDHYLVQSIWQTRDVCCHIPGACVCKGTTHRGDTYVYACEEWGSTRRALTISGIHTGFCIFVDACGVCCLCVELFCALKLLF